VRFKSLGLVIVDEEHRFGVAHKEKLKAYRAAVDVLSLTATPIPRTLHMALSGIRDLSVIDTPPPGRLDIATQIVHHDPELLAAAIRTELDRDGQVFFLHNRVDDIDTVAETLATLVPEARIGIAHGQMREHQLEAAMLSFMHRKYDLLLCTTIIESGLDLPNVNTLIVNQADRFGLAQLYQIRGRIGRSSRKAFAYFVVPPLETMTGDARSRLAVLAKFSAVGSGFRVAEMDLELRGAGDLLGADQAGHIAGVGFDMYIHLLQEAVERLRAVEERPERTECTVEIPVAASIPESYIEDRHARLVAYRRIATADSLPGLEALRHELKDRFGPVPALTVRLFSVAELRLRGQALGLSKIECTGTQVRIHVAACPDAVLQKLVHLIARQPLRLSAAGDRILAADFSHEPETDPVSRTRRVLALMEK
jgi:transcription-repair coupling factor (superfamily II helicase)